MASRVAELGEVFLSIERMVARGQEDGALRGDVDARLASYLFYGAIEEILTGWVLEQLPDGDDEVAAAERAVVDVIAGGLAASPATVA